MSFDLCFASLSELAPLISSRKLSSLRLVQAFLDRIGSHARCDIYEGRIISAAGEVGAMARLAPLLVNSLTLLNDRRTRGRT